MLNKESLHNHLITRRAFILGGCGGVAFSLLASRMFYMQIVKSDDYKLLSDNNRINPIIIHPLRGDIFDCKGRLLAGSSTAFYLILDKHQNKNYKESLELLYQILDLNEDERNIIKQRINKYGLKIPISIMDNIPWFRVALIEENIAHLPGLYVEVGQLRKYNYNDVFTHVIGYTGILNEEEKQEIALNNIGNFNVGKNGVEKYYDKILRGNFGIKKMEVNANGRYIRELSNQESEKGQPINLNIDASLQETIFNLLPKTGASAIVMDVHNGRILSAVSSPSFDPNKFVKKISPEDWKNLNNNPYHPLLNRISQGTYPPGSIFKLITVLAALEHGMDPNTKVDCAKGASALGNSFYRCWNLHGHGPLDMKEAIKHSCNAYMYKIIKTIGGEKVLELAKKLGFGNITGIDLPSESAGFVPSSDWKKRRFKKDWQIGDSLNIGIGQGALLVTTIQLARFGSIIASKGKLCTPSILGQRDVTQLDINQAHFDFLHEAMFDVINSAGGTAYNKRVLDPNWSFSGKTGTSQVQAKKGNQDLNNVKFSGRNHALFLGFTPSHNPKYSIMVVVDHGGSGASAAAPIARDITIELSKLNS